jgi:hypothetical protein
MMRRPRGTTLVAGPTVAHVRLMPPTGRAHVARGLAESGPVEVHEVGEVAGLPEDLDLLVVGGPTHAFSMSRASTREDARTKSTDGSVISQGVGLREWIDGLPHASRQVPAATFDTKVRHPRLPGSAARSASRALKAHGYRMATAPETFDVDGTTGPLLTGETDRAAAWGAALAASVHSTG